MICPRCKTGLTINKNKVLSHASRFRCPKCGAVFAARKPASSKSEDMVLRIGGNGTLLELKGRLDNNLCIAQHEITGKHITDVMLSDLAQPIMRSIEKVLQTGDMQSFEYEHLNGHPYYSLKFIAGGPDSVLVIVSNISDYKETEKKISYLAYHDNLTQLPNRYLFYDRLRQAMAYADRENRMIAIMFLDLDNFKTVNDTLGHQAGDKLLKSFAERLVTAVRVTDSISHFYLDESELVTARLGGDEFVLLLNNIEHVQDPAVVAGRIFRMLSEPFLVDSHEIFVTASAGIAVYPHDGKDVDSLLANADVAMYEAKKHGKNSYRYYSESMNKYAFERFVVEGKLRKALAHNEFMLFYQPQVNIHTGRLIGVEALIRWLQPDLVLTRPGEFIPLAEQSGLIVPIGEWILRAACEQNKVWQRAGLAPMLMTVNVSGIQFAQENFVETIAAILTDTKLEPQYLQLELTESTIMHDYDKTVTKLRALQTMGIKISIDDFGTGYSSLKYLKYFPLDTLKIDSSFIKDLIENITDQSIVNAIIALAHNFSLKVVAEGVETEEQLTYLRENGCDAVQGYLVCPPVNQIIFAEFAKKQKNAPGTGNPEGPGAFLSGRRMPRTY